MAGRLWKPPVGTKVWFACEHFWRRPGATKWQPEYEFMVYQGEVRSYRTGNWTDVNIKYRSEEGPIELIDIVLRADRQTIFDFRQRKGCRALCAGADKRISEALGLGVVVRDVAGYAANAAAVGEIPGGGDREKSFKQHSRRSVIGEAVSNEQVH